MELEGRPKGPGGVEIVRGGSPYLSQLFPVLLVFFFALGSMALTQGVRIHLAISASEEGILAYGVNEW